MGFRINNVGKMRLATDGKFGIGTTTPTSLLTVAGDTSLNGDLDVENNVLVKGDLSINTVTGTHLKLSTSKLGVGRDAGQISQGSYALAIGDHAGNSSQGQYSVAIGNFAGETSQGFSNVAIGNVAGRSNQGNYGIAMGFYAGNHSQGTVATAIGAYAGQTNQSQYGIGLGYYAGNARQQENSIAIGYSAGAIDQCLNSVAIGTLAGLTYQGKESVAIGYSAGNSSQHANTIVLNAQGVALNTSDTSGLYVAPIRETDYSSQGVLYYNSSTKEITYDLSKVGVATGDDLSLSYLDLSGTLKIQERPVKTVLDNYVTSRNLTVVGGGF